jgi:hypothetical protein
MDTRVITGGRLHRLKADCASVVASALHLTDVMLAHPCSPKRADYNGNQSLEVLSKVAGGTSLKLVWSIQRLDRFSSRPGPRPLAGGERGR